MEREEGLFDLLNDRSNIKNMAKYAISKEGLEALQVLALNIQNAGNGIINSSVTLLNEINGLENELGVYFRHILLLVEKVIVTIQQAKEGNDGIDSLTQKHIPRLINAIETVYGFDSGSDDDDVPYQNEKKLRR